MGKSIILMLLVLLLLSGLVMVGSVSAQSIPTPSVPEFTIEFVNASYLETTTNPYTGLDETELTSDNSIKVTIKNQPFDYSNNQIYYNVRVKPHFGDDWTEIYPVKNTTSSHIGDGTFSYAEYINDDSPTQWYSSYTIITFPVGEYYSSGYYIQRYDSGYGSYFKFLSPIPDNGQVDFQVEALVGHNSQVWIIEHPFYPEIGGHFEQAVAFDISSGWSNTQTVTIGESQPPSPEPTTPTSPSPLPSEEPQQPEQDMTAGAVLAVISFVVFLGLLFYFIKRR